MVFLKPNSDSNIKIITLHICNKLVPVAETVFVIPAEAGIQLFTLTQCESYSTQFCRYGFGQAPDNVGFEAVNGLVS